MAQRIYVTCLLRGHKIDELDFRIAGSLAGPGTYDAEELMTQAKAHLSHRGKATPPWTGLTFELRAEFVP